MYRLFLITVLFIQCVLCYNKEVGDVCKRKHDDRSGICLPITECKEVLDGLYANPERIPYVCSFQQNTLIVCCQSSSSKRVEKCQKYAEYMFQTKIYPSFRPGGKDRVIRKNRCGRNGATLIIGGVEALSREYPHSALVGYSKYGEITWQCGGSLVSSRYVVTAAHCLKHLDNGRVVKVRLGELDYNTTTDDATPTDFDIENIICYPEYKPSSKYHDIALLKLSSKVELSPYIRPICLPTKNIEPDEYIATGWGLTTNYGNRSTALLKVMLESFPYEECQHRYRYYLSRKLRNGLQLTQLCAGHRTEERDTSNGDSGGPLEIYHPSIPCSSILIGITSFDVPSATPKHFPGVYTRVYRYADWIESVIWAAGEDI